MSSDNATPRPRAREKSLWRRSLLVRRVTAGSVFALAAAAVYLASHIPRAVSLPSDELNAKAVARLEQEQIVIGKPEIGPGELVRSPIKGAGMRSPICGWRTRRLPRNH